MIKKALNKLVLLEEISCSEIREVFDEIFSGLANEIQASSFITAINNYENVEDFFICGLESARDKIKKPFLALNSNDLMQNISFSNFENVIDINLLQDLVCSSCELPIVKYSFNNAYAREKSFEILSLLGINFEKEIDYNSVDWEKLNFNYFYLPCDSPFFKYSENIRKNLPFDNVLNKIIKFLNPLNAKNLYLGVKDRKDVEKYAAVALKLNKQNSIIVNGANNLPYISSNGESYVAEAWKNKIFTYILTPELLEIKSYDYSETLCENNEACANDIIEIISGKQKGAKYNLAILNSALSLYISKKADSILDGAKLAKKLLDEGIVLQKFEQIKKFYL